MGTVAEMAARQMEKDRRGWAKDRRESSQMMVRVPILPDEKYLPRSSAPTQTWPFGAFEVVRISCFRRFGLAPREDGSHLMVFEVELQEGTPEFDRRPEELRVQWVPWMCVTVHTPTFQLVMEML